MPTSNPPLAAVILCGGESRRMGQPKVSLPFGPESLLQRVVRLVSSSAYPIIVVAAPNQPLPQLPAAITIVRDAISGRGPLEGLAAGFAALPSNTQLAYATATDVPFLAPSWIIYLASLIATADLAIPQIGGFLHPLAALYRPSTTLPAIRELLAQNQLRPTCLVDVLNARITTEAEMRSVDPHLRTLINLNEPADYHRALAQRERADTP